MTLRPFSFIVSALGAFAASAMTLAAPASVDEALRVLQDNSIYTAPPERIDELKRAAIDSIVKKVDPHAEYLSPGGVNSFENVPRIASALGFELIETDGQRYLVPFAAGALADAGFLDVVRLVAIDGKPVAAMTTEALLKDLRARPNVRLDIQGLKAGSPVQSVAIASRPLRVESVEQLKVDGVTVIRIREFRALETRTALIRALQSIPKRQTVAVIDLRFNRGGDVVSAIEAASLFAPDGRRLAALEDKKGARREFFAVADAIKFKQEVALVISHNTASAAETFLRALMRYRKTRVAGERSYGKCTSQSQFRLSDGAFLVVSAYRVLDADLKACGGVGVMPTVSLRGLELMDIGVALARLQVRAAPNQ